MNLKGKAVAVLVEDIYEDLELWYPAKADRAAEDVAANDYDAVIIPGGYSPDRMRRVPAMVNLVADAVREGKTVAAICHGGWLLCSAGVLQGRQATSFFSIKDDMTNAGAEWVDREVVRDGNLITSRQPDDLPAFLQTIIETLVQSPVAV
jgi:protease I